MIGNNETRRRPPAETRRQKDNLIITSPRRRVSAFPRPQSGFTLLELMITMFIIIILLSVALPAYQSSVQQARENVLRQNLWQMRRQIDQFATDKGKLPQSLDDLVKANYLRELPVDPITEKAEWREIQGEDTNSLDAEQGLKDVKSLAEGEDANGKKYEDY
ncbi:MAG: type II secretion system GspH family protein [Acidobacteriota bacterium]|nr:type II secretion system GspH family protein [Acidobacteriota bacterium]